MTLDLGEPIKITDGYGVLSLTSSHHKDLDDRLHHSLSLTQITNIKLNKYTGLRAVRHEMIKTILFYHPSLTNS